MHLRALLRSLFFVTKGKQCLERAGGLWHGHPMSVGSSLWGRAEPPIQHFMASGKNLVGNKLLATTGLEINTTSGLLCR